MRAINNRIYFDNAATTRVCDAAVSAVTDAMTRRFGNPSSQHGLGVESERMINDARNKIATEAKVNRQDIYFTSGGTESNNLAIRGVCNRLYRKGRIITTKIEHKSVSVLYGELEKQGFEVVYLPVNGRGIVDLDVLESAVNEETDLVSIIYVNNETGTIQPAEEIRKVIKSRNPGTLLHFDAVQALGKVPIPKDAADLMTFSAHKIHGPKGVGALYAGKQARMSPILYGGGQEKGLRSGTENVPAIMGFSAALGEISLEEDFARVRKLHDKLRSRLEQAVDGIHFFSPRDGSPYILNLAIEGAKSEVFLHSLEQEGLFVSNGSACSSNRPAPSHVLLAMGVPRQLVENSIRLSFSRLTTEAEIEEAADMIAVVGRRLQRITRR